MKVGMETDFLNSEVYKWLYKNRENSASRYPTFSTALKLLNKRGGKTIVETGCVRLQDDWGGGMSTVIFGRYCHEFGGQLTTIDNSQKAMIIAKALTEEWADSINYVIDDSLNALQDFEGQIDLLYLDSLDYPIDWILERFGRKDWGHAIGEALKLPDSEVEKEYGHLIAPCQEHQLYEITEAYDKLAPDALILLDDVGFPLEGKTRLSKKFLLENGWKTILQEQQVLLSR